MALALVPRVVRGRMIAQSSLYMLVAMRRPVILTCTREMRQFNFSDAHMNELPVPKGSFKDYQEERQFMYLMTLAIGIAVFLASLLALFLLCDVTSKLPDIVPEPEPVCYEMIYTGPQDEEGEGEEKTE